MLPEIELFVNALRLATLTMMRYGAMTCDQTTMSQGCDVSGKCNDGTNLNVAEGFGEYIHNRTIGIDSPSYKIQQKGDGIKGIRFDKHCDGCGGGCVQSARSVWSPYGLSNISYMEGKPCDNHEREKDVE